MAIKLRPEKLTDVLIDALKWLLLIAICFSAFLLIFKFSWEPGFEWVSTTLITLGTISSLYLLLLAPNTLVYFFLELSVLAIIPALISALLLLGMGAWYISLPLVIYSRIIHRLYNMPGFKDLEQKSKSEIAYENHYLIQAFQYGWRLYWNKH